MGFLKNPILDPQNSRWRRSANLKIVKSPYINEKSPANLELDDSQMTKLLKIFKIQDGVRPPL